MLRCQCVFAVFHVEKFYTVQVPLVVVFLRVGQRERGTVINWYYFPLAFEQVHA